MRDVSAIVEHPPEDHGRHRLVRIAELTRDVGYRLSLAPEPTLEYVSPNVFDLLGVTAEELLGDPRRWRELILDEDRPHLTSAAARAFQRFGRRDLCRHIEGHILWVDARHVLVRSPTGDVIGTEWLVRDVTNMVLARKLLQETMDVLEVPKLDPSLTTRVRGLLADLTHDLVGLSTQGG